ncbi:Ssy1 protein [Martiniozyma asiatica (nom. inval.)]|nr:Ssy1 protein [Martiniozyma asiatica]
MNSLFGNENNCNSNETRPSDDPELINSISSGGLFPRSALDRPTYNISGEYDGPISDDENVFENEIIYDMDDTDIRSSVLHRILDSNDDDEDTKHDKVYYTKLYNKYTGDGNHAEDATDFTTYDKMMKKEDLIKKKLNTLATRLGKNNGSIGNTLTTLQGRELDDIFDRPLTAKEWNDLEAQTKYHLKRSRLKRWFAHRSPSPAITNQVYTSKSSISTVPIDDAIDIEDIPIDLQPVRRRRKNSSNSIEMIVSNEDKVDYNLRRIAQYQDFDPIGKFQKAKTKTKIKKFIEYFNILKIIRVQRANNYQIQRKLNVGHLHQIALGGTLGVGLLLSSGKAFSIAGPLGCLLGFTISGFIILAAMLSFCEIVTVIPLCGGVSGIASRFVDDAFGFALGVTYWVAYMISLPTEITAAAIMLSFYSNLNIPGPSTSGWISLFYAVSVLINLFDIRVYGEFEYYSTILKLLMLVALMFYNIILNAGKSAPDYKKIGTIFWNSNKSIPADNIFFGPFRPTFDVLDVGLGATNGIGGNKGRFLQVIIASIVAAYAYIGTEIVIIAGSEASNPRRSIPSATKNIYWRIIIFYLVAIFIIGLNVYSGDPRLLRFYNSNVALTPEVIEQRAKVVEIISGSQCIGTALDYAGFSNGNQSPWVIAIQSAGLCSFAGVINAFLLYFALTAGTSQLYASSRTLYFMAIQNKAPSIFTLCTKKGVPYMSVLFTGLFGSLSFLSVQADSAVVFQQLASVAATAGLLVWTCMCLSFIRFFYALKLRPDIYSREDENYPYRSPFQPYLAYFGMISAFFLVLASGFVVFLNNDWDSKFFVCNYGSLFLFIACYGGYRLFRRTKVHKLDQIDLDSGRREIDRIIWEDDKERNAFRIIWRGLEFFTI